jgi:hypothetical protein
MNHWLHDADTWMPRKQLERAPNCREPSQVYVLFGDFCSSANPAAGSEQ